MTQEPQRGEEHRFAALYRANHRAVLAFAQRRVGEAHAQDIVAETFLTAWRHLDRAPQEGALPWLYCIAGNAVANHRRAVQRQVRLNGRLLSSQPTSVSDAHGGRGDHAEQVVESDRVEAALRRLSPLDQEALRLSVWEDLSVVDAATAMGCSVTAMKVRLHRARRRFAQQLGTDPDDTRTQTLILERAGEAAAPSVQGGPSHLAPLELVHAAVQPPQPTHSLEVTS